MQQFLISSRTFIIRNSGRAHNEVFFACFIQVMVQINRSMTTRREDDLEAKQYQPQATAEISVIMNIEFRIVQIDT